MIKSIYVIGSLRNPNIPLLGNKLREKGYEVFEDWFSSGPETDDYWQKYEQTRGRSYEEALKGYMAEHIFQFDKHHLDRTDAVVLLMPAGKSGHLELGYTVGKGKPAFVLFDKEPERWDVMYLFTTGVFFLEDKLLQALEGYNATDRTGASCAAGQGHSSQLYETSGQQSQDILSGGGAKEILRVKSRCTDSAVAARASKYPTCF